MLLIYPSVYTGPRDRTLRALRRSRKNWSNVSRETLTSGLPFRRVLLSGRWAMLKFAGLCGTFSILTLGSFCSTWVAAVATFGLYVVTGGWRFLRIVFFTARRDLT